jgi:DNA-binding response OmpR family regulator
VIADAERQRPALFVLDIMVPGKDGLELCRTVRQTQGLAAVPVIFLTAKSSEADRVLGLETRSRRLHRQALQPARTRRPRQGRAAPF